MSVVSGGGKTERCRLREPRWAGLAPRLPPASHIEYVEVLLRVGIAGGHGLA